MFTARTIVLLAATSLLIVSPARAASTRWSCYGSLAAILRANDFPGADCRRASVKIAFLGSVRQGADKYLVYQYGYADDPAKIGGVEPHALKRILIFKNKLSDYLGNYAMDAGFDAEVHSNAIHVRTETPKMDGDIHIGPDGPPDTVSYGGDEASFDRPGPGPR